ncbi:MAG TPA: glutathione S-transferase N-terminal domain-containing protein, partial [Polyangiales bacterium]|nr:glutathione S-transferase N-terminal domain-containing protein [Polyangiales bacterium]
MRIAGTSLRPLEIWRPDVSLEQARNFGSSLLATAVRLGSGGIVRGIGPRPDNALILYELEWCPYSRLVREALSELDLDALIKPCPKGEREHHSELEKHGQSKFPYLIDRAAGVEL